MRQICLIAILLIFINCFAKNSSIGSQHSSHQPATLYLYAPRMSHAFLDFLDATPQTIFLNNRPLVRIEDGQYIKFHLNTGAYTLTASTDRQRACNGTFDNALLFPPFKLSVTNGHTYFLYYGGSESPDVRYGTCERHIGLTTAQKGLYALQHLDQPVDTYEGSFRQSVDHFLKN